MSEFASALDEFSFVRAEMTAVEPHPRPLDDCLVRTMGVTGSARSFHFSLPFFVGEIGLAETGATWSVFCGLLRRFGIPIFSSVAALDGVAAALVPPRLGRRFVNEALDVLELTTADAFEIACCDRGFENWGWSSELSRSQLGDFVSAVREAAGGDTPIGVGLSLDCHPQDVQACIEADIDFLRLYGRSTRIELFEVQCLMDTRRACGSLGHADLPILVSAPICQPDDACKLLALGASVVGLDGLLASRLQPNMSTAAAKPSASAGMLKGIATSPSRAGASLPEAEKMLQQCKQLLETRMRSVGATTLNEFNTQCLRSASPLSERLRVE